MTTYETRLNAIGRWLQGLGPAFAADVAFCATLDAQPTVVGW